MKNRIINSTSCYVLRYFLYTYCHILSLTIFTLRERAAQIQETKGKVVLKRKKFLNLSVLNI